MFETPWGRVGVAICYDMRFPLLAGVMRGGGGRGQGLCARARAWPAVTCVLTFFCPPFATRAAEQRLVPA